MFDAMLAIDFEAVAQRCAPTVALSTLRAIATVESGLNPYAIGIVAGQLSRQPRSLLEGLATATSLQQSRTRFSAGIAQIYVGNWPALGLTPETVFEPCSNLRAAAAILGHCYQRARVAGTAKDTDQQSLRRAISCYYANNFTTGFSEGYVQKVVATAIRHGAHTPAGAHSSSKSGQ